MPRILVITDSYPHRERPYLTTFNHEHAKVLSRTGSVKVLTLIRGRKFGIRKYKWEGIEVEAFEMPYKPKVGLIFLPLAIIMHFLLITINLIKYRPDISVLQMSLPHGIAYLPFELLKITPAFILEHSTHIQESLFNRTMFKIIAKIIKNIYAVSTFHKNILQKSTGVQIKGVIPNPIRDFSNACTERRTPLAKRVIFIGSLVERKRPDLFIKAAQNLPDIEFILIGSGNADSYKPFPENVKYLGALDHHETIRNLCKSDLLVSTSEYETFGVAIAEALALGKPVVWTDSGGPRDFLNESNSVQIEEKTPESVAKAIREAYDKLKKGFFNAENIKKGILRYAGVESVEKRYREIIEGILQNRVS